MFTRCLGALLLIGTASAAEGQPVRLPQDHDYQRVLREYLGRLTEADFQVQRKPYRWQEDWIKDEQDQDQWSFYQRDVAAAMASPHAFYLAFGGRSGRRPDYAVADPATMRARLASFMNRPAPEPSDRTPPVWQETHWPYRDINYAADYYRDGFYDRVVDALQDPAPQAKAPFEREGETFLRNFADTFLVARYDHFGVILYTGPLGWHPYMNYGGGALSAFWTPAMGAVLLGHAAGDHTRAPWPEWRSWPSHALSGATADGRAFSSARVRRRMLDVQYRIDQLQAEVIVAGPIGAQHDGGRAVQDGAIRGDARYRRRFAVSPAGLEIETTWSYQGTDEIAELYESLPVYLRDARRDQAPAIHFRADGRWIEGRAERVPGVDAVRVQRGDHSILIELDAARPVRLAPEVFEDDYMTRNRVHNVHICLLDPDRAEPPPTASVRYTIRPH